MLIVVRLPAQARRGHRSPWWFRSLVVGRKQPQPKHQMLLREIKMTSRMMIQAFQLSLHLEGDEVFTESVTHLPGSLRQVYCLFSVSTYLFLLLGPPITRTLPQTKESQFTFMQFCQRISNLLKKKI